MNKKIVFTGTGHKHQILGMEISNFLPHKHSQAVGHFVGFTIAGNVTINDTAFSEGNLVVFSAEGDTIQLENTTNQPTDIILFGGEPYTENIVAQGPFAMNSPAGDF